MTADTSTTRSPTATTDADRRFRLAGHAAHRKARARGRRLLRDRAHSRAPKRPSRSQAQGVILSGGPCSVTEEGSPRAPQAIFDSGVPISPSLWQSSFSPNSSAARSRPVTTRIRPADVEAIAESALFEASGHRARNTPCG